MREGGAAAAVAGRSWAGVLLGSAGLGWHGGKVGQRPTRPAGGRKAMGRNEKEEGREMKKPFSFYF